jgi:iron complex transport system ATP-binding protein
VTTLSGGERQRVHLARAFAQLGSAADQTGKWLLLDEPTAALDLAHQLAALGASRQFARAGGGVLAVLHDLRLACRYADRVAVLRSGRIAASGAPAEALSLSCVRDVYGLEEDSLDLFLDVTRPCARRAKCDAPMPDHARQVEPAGSGR